MMMHIPMDIAPTRIASAIFCSSTISFHRWYGVILSVTAKATRKIRMPSSAKMRAFSRAPGWNSIMSFSSDVMWKAAVDGAVGARIVPHRAGNALHFIDPQRAPAAILGPRRQDQQQQAVAKIDGMSHESSPKSPMLNVKREPESLSCQRAFSKWAARRLTNTGGMSSSRPAIQKRSEEHTSEL